MKTPRQILPLTTLVVLILVNNAMLKGQSGYENPWGGGMPAEIENLAFERHPVEGFAWPTSVLPGDTIRFYVSVMDLEPQGPLSQQYEMTIFRSPDFGAGQEVYSFTNATGHFYPLRDANGDSIVPGQTDRLPVDYKIGCKDFWSPTARAFTQTSNLPSGMYFARLNHLTLNDPNQYYYIPFVVRATQPGQATKILFKFDLNTVQAYNYWGGGSLYSLGQDPSTLTSDSIIAFDRPINGDISHYASSYYVPFEKTLRDSGYSMEYCNNIDADRDTTLDILSKYSTLVFINHDEYWSRNERINIESFKGDHASGLHGNIARFAANTCYWRINWIGGSGNDKYLKLKCLKDNYPDTLHDDIDKWRKTGEGPEAKFLGSQYETGWNYIGFDPETEQPPDRVQKPGHWIFKNANLFDVGQEFGKGVMQDGRQRGIVSNEVDNTIDNMRTYNFNFPMDTLAGRKVYSNINGVHDSVLHQMVYYEDTVSNARVFGQGAMGWLYGLAGTIDTNDVVRMKTITMNIISHFSGKKYIGKVYTRPQFPLEWNSSIVLDGNVQIPQSKYLKAQSCVITVDSNFTIDGTLEVSGAVSLAGSGIITIGPTGQIVLVNGATLTLDTASTMVLGRDNAIVFGSGSQLQIFGLLRTTYGNYTTVPYGATLRIRPGAVLQWGSYGSLVIEGTLSAIGTTNNPIIITKAPGELAPGGVYLSYGSVDTLEHCLISDVYTGVSIDSCLVSLRYNSFVNCSFAVSSNGWKWSPVVEGNTVDSCYIGLDIYTSSTIGHPTLQGNDIQHCDYGVVLNPSYSSTLTNNRIHLNGTGVLVDGSSPILRGNIIESNAVDGVYATNYSNPRLGDYSFNDPGSNVIRYNGESQIHSSFSEPFLGLSYYDPSGECDPPDPSMTLGGFNSVYDAEGHSYLVFTGKGSSVDAQANWWGECPPDDNRFFSDGWPLDYSLPLNYDPNDGMRPSRLLTSSDRDGQESGVMNPRTLNRELRQALLLRSQHNYAGAVALYSTLVASNLNEADAHTALMELRHTYHDYLRWSNDTTLQAALESYLRTQSAYHPRAAIKRLAKSLRASELGNMGNYQSALGEYQQLLQSSSSEDERITYLFELFNLNALRLVNSDEAQRYLFQMQNEFPADGRTRIAAIRFEGMTYRTSGNGLQKSSLAGTDEQTRQLPQQFSLSQNFPNPFNPTTVIQYELPVDANVVLRVYDVLGREVHTLVNETVKAGYQKVNFDASQFSTGVYFYQLTAGEFTQTRKLLLIK